MRDIAHLRHETATVPVTGLASVSVRALEATGVLCWDSLDRVWADTLD